MKRIFILLFMVVLVVSVTAQKRQTNIQSEIKENTKPNVSFFYKANLSAKENVQMINYKKSKDLFSIKTYRKASRLRSKKIRVC